MSQVAPMDALTEQQLHPYGPTQIFFIGSGLFIGAIAREINKKTGIPYSPMLILIGVILGYFYKHLGQLGYASYLFEKLHPHTGLLIFVPSLMFTAAFKANYFMFRKSLVNILILTIPGVIIGALLMSFIIKVVLNYGDDQLSWYQAMAMGCALAATDPVAVVTMLKQMGSSAKFNTLIEGQSIMNGGVSMVFYVLFMSMANGHTTNAFEFSVYMVRLSVGGCLLGLFFGIFISFWMKRIIRDHTLSIVITFIGSYMSFYLAEFTWLKFSGVLAVVIQGLYMAAVVKRKIYPQSQQALQTVWSTMAYSAMTIVFILGGLIAGIQFTKFNTITSEDWFKMVGFWFLMIAVRALIITAFYPILQSRGYGLSKKQLVILIYGGLKGALGLSLAMIVTVDSSYPDRFRHLFTFYMAGMVVMTVVINGLTCKTVLDYVELIHIPEIKNKLFKRCVRQVTKHTQQKVEQLKINPDLAYANWKQVQNLVEIDTHFANLPKQQKQVDLQAMRDSLIDLKQNQMIQQIRFRFTRYLSKLYWKYHSEGQVSEQAIRVLSQNCDVCNDNASQKLNYFEIMSSVFTMQTVKMYVYFKDWAFIGPHFTRMLTSKIYFIYQVSIVFIEATEQSIRVFTNDFPLYSSQLKEVLQEAKDNIDQAVAYVNEIESNFPEVIQAVHTRRASTILLNTKKNRLIKMYEQGFIDELQYQDLRRQIDVSLARVKFNEVKLQQIKINEILVDCPLFNCLSRQQVTNIRIKANEKKYQKGDILLERESSIDTILVVLSGSVKQEYGSFYMTRSTGNIINPYDFTYNQQSQCTAKAMSNVTTMQIKTQVINELLKNNLDFRKKWYKSLFHYEIRHNKTLEFLHKRFSEKELRRFVEASQIKVLSEGEVDISQNGYYLFDGQVQSEGQTIKKGQYIEKEKTVKARKWALLLKFKEVAGLKMAEASDKLRVSNYIDAKKEVQ